MDNFFKNKFQEYLMLSIILLTFIVFYIETDIYTPTFPEMVDYFQTDEDSIQLLLSMNFLGLCLSSLLFGPASDAYGRKSTLCTGLFVFMAGSMGCAMTQDFNLMIVFRFIQGIGCGAIVSVALTSLFDIYSPEKYSRLVSACNVAIGGMMALAPVIGNWIGIQWGWRANFHLIAFLATVVFLSNLFLTRETLRLEKRTQFSTVAIFKNYFSLLTNLPFMSHTLIWCLMFSLGFVFIANLSLIYIDYLQVPVEIFGYYQMAIMGAFFFGSLLSAYLIKKWGMPLTKTFGSLVYLLGVVLLVTSSYRGVNSPLILIISMALASLGSSLTCAIYFSYSLTYIGEHLKGSAMSLTQSLRLALSSGLVWLAASRFDGSTKPISEIALLCTATCLALYVLLYRRSQLFAPAIQ